MSRNVYITNASANRIISYSNIFSNKADKLKGEYWKTNLRFFNKKDENEINPIFMANIEFLNRGKLVFNIDTLHVQYPREMDLKKDLSEVLKVIGYFAADEIIDFAENNKGEHNISGLFGRNSKEICDIDFDDIKQATIDLEELYKDI